MNKLQILLILRRYRRAERRRKITPHLQCQFQNLCYRYGTEYIASKYVALR